MSVGYDESLQVSGACLFFVLPSMFAWPSPQCVGLWRPPPHISRDHSSFPDQPSFAVRAGPAAPPS